MRIIKVKNANQYFISDCGKLFNVNKKLLSPAISDRGYYKYPIKLNNGEVKTIRIHRLVADAFLDKKENCNEVNHIDGNKLNNHSSNLEWVDRSKNMFHYFNKNGNQWSRKTIIDYKTGIFYESALECAKLLGIPKSTLTCMLTGYRKNKTSLSYC